MLFPTLSVSVLGFAAVVCAAPHLHSRFEKDPAAKRDSLTHSARGLTWTPKRQSSINDFASLSNFNSFGAGFNNDFVSFQQETVIVINQNQNDNFDDRRRQDEEQIVVLIQQQLFAFQSDTFAKDNIRRNHYNSRNNNVNTVILIVQAVDDNRDDNNRNRRYYTRQIESNRNARDQQVVIIVESNVIAIGGDSFGNEFFGSGSGFSSAVPTGVSTEVAPAATGVAARQSLADLLNFAIYDPNVSQFPGFNSDLQLLPFGIDQPSFNYGREDVDPAIIILADQAVFIAFSDDNQRRQDDEAVAQIIAIS